MNINNIYAVISVLTLAIGCSASQHKASRIKQYSQNNSSSDSGTSGNTGPRNVDIKLDEKSDLLGISEEELKVRIAEKAKVAKSSTDMLDNKIDASNGVASPDKAVIIAKEQIAIAFEANLKANPDAMTKEDADYLKDKLNAFVDQSVAGNTKEATVAWNQFSDRIEKIRMVPKNVDPWVAKKKDDGKVIVIVDNKPGTGILTSLFRVADKVIDSGAGLVSSLFGQPMVAISSSAKSLVDQIFVLVI